MLKGRKGEEMVCVWVWGTGERGCVNRETCGAEGMGRVEGKGWRVGGGIFDYSGRPVLGEKQRSGSGV